jgi:transposase
MSNKPIPMQKLKQVIRLYGQGKGSKSINSMLGVSRNTIKKYLQIFHSSGMSYEQFFSMNAHDLSLMFQVNQSPAPSVKQLDLESLLPELCKQLKRKGVTRDHLHSQYLEQHPDGYCRSRFNNYIQLHLGQSSPVMHIEHKAGEKMYIDFAGEKLYLDVPASSRIAVEVFVAVLGCSQLTYVEAVFSQKKEDLIRVCENALHYFEGVPRVIVPDNLKSAVTKGSKYEAIINPDFACFAEHYSTTVIPARVYKPRDKSLVEGAVKLVYKNIYTKLTGRVFHDLDSLNAAIRVGLELHNNTPFSGRDYSRRQQFEEIEREALGKLHPFRYELKEQALVTVMKNGYVRLSKDVHYYSVPYQHIGKKVKILYASQEVEVYFRYELIAKHQRDTRRYQYTTDASHLASQHQFITEWCPESFLKRATEIHEDVASYIAKVLELKPFPEQAYKSCWGILSFARRVGHQRLIDACRWAESFGQYSYRTIEEILYKRLDQLKPEGETNHIPTHENIRGKEYYQ